MGIWRGTRVGDSQLTILYCPSKPGFRGHLYTVKPVFRRHLTTVKPVFRWCLNTVKHVFRGHLYTVKPVSRGYLNTVKPVFRGHLFTVKPVFRGYLNTVKPVFRGHLFTVNPVFRGYLNTVKPVFRGNLFYSSKNVGNSILSAKKTWHNFFYDKKMHNKIQTKSHQFQKLYSTPPWHGACTCKVSRKYNNAFLSYSAKTKRDGRTETDKQMGAFHDLPPPPIQIFLELSE